ncbi:hypothetical protein M407DRAFT_231241 [Tulasnella calospora MUT 4182]|uniref:HSF-type DNA-binding domain-containing protein n=1 Tax=Tulasnella calospora MUT 4182 TaxID=1051891 RepID=A0A0C3K5E2_9AGAM|nr:hypothetical protein M407DRAFT_231241 [Tulasnella calospora MUT 4182]
MQLSITALLEVPSPALLRPSFHEAAPETCNLLALLRLSLEATRMGPKAPPGPTERAEAPHLRQHESDVLMEEENDEQYVEPGPSSQPPGRICQSKFPYQLYRMIEDKQMEDYIRWDAPHVFQVLNIENFVKNALPEYFPRMKDAAGQAQPPMPCIPTSSVTIPQPFSQVDLYAKISQVEDAILQLKAGCMHQSAKESRLFAKEKRLLAREKLLFARETRLFAKEKRLATREKRLTAREKSLAARESRLEREFQPQEPSGEQRPISTQAGFSYPIDQTGSAELALDHDSEMGEAGDSLDGDGENACTPGIGTTDGGNVLGVFSHPETEATLDVSDPAPVTGQPPLQPSSSPLSTDPTPSLPYANEQQDPEEHNPGDPALYERVAAWQYSHFNPFSGSWWQQDSSAAVPASPPPASAHASSGPGSKGPVAQVPNKSPPGSGRCWLTRP